MELLLVLFIAALFWLWMQVSRLSERLTLVDRQLIDATDNIRVLQRQALEGFRPHAPAPPEEVVPSRTPTAPVGVVRVTTTPVIPATTPSAPMPMPEIAPEQLPATAPREESWEITVGTSWFNKIGVLTLVIGVAFLVAYSFNNIGPAGRIAIGYALSGTILGAGVWLERRDQFRNYAYGLIAGGWGGLYFTTFAMHDIPAAKIIESDLVAVSLLSIVAAGMIAHSLRYRSQVVTTLTFVVAYSTLALSPLSGFALAASVPLALSVLVVSQRLGWPAVSAIGIAATYGVFVLRSAVYPGGAMDRATPLPYVTLAAYWLTFDIADLIGLHLRRRALGSNVPARASMLALNAAGFLGALVIISPGTRPELRALVMFAAGTAYIASAVIRAWLLPERRSQAERERPFDSSHAATAVAVFLFAIGVAWRFPESGEGLAWLLEAQLLFVAGLTLSDRWLRRMASIVAALVTMHVWMSALFSRNGGELLMAGVTTHAAIAVMVAMIWYANRETIRSRGDQPAWLEPAYAWAGTALLITAGWVVLTPSQFCLAGWVLAPTLLEAGLRRDHEYTLQSYVMGGIAAYMTAIAFLTPVTADGTLRGWGVAPSSFDDWTVLPAGIAACVAMAIRLVTFQGTRPAPAQVAAASVLVTLAAALAMLLEWRVLSTDAVAPAWVATGVVVLSLGLWRSVKALRWQGYAMLALGALRASGPVLGRPDAAASAIAWLVACAIAIYVMALAARRFTREAPLGESWREAEDFAITGLLIGATALVSGTIVTQAEASTVTLILALQGLGLMATGLAARERVMRASGLALLTSCLLKLFLYDLRELEPLPRIFSFVVFGLVLLAISWAYTRYREQIRKLL